MKIRSYVEARKAFLPGDEVWACAYSYDGNKEGRLYFQEPVLGKITCRNTESAEKRELQDTSTWHQPNYFVPYKKNGRDLAWSKAVSIGARCYAFSKEECIELYNELIQENINWHLNAIHELQDAMIEMGR